MDRAEKESMLVKTLRKDKIRLFATLEAQAGPGDQRIVDRAVKAVWEAGGLPVNKLRIRDVVGVLAHYASGHEAAPARAGSPRRSSAGVQQELRSAERNSLGSERTPQVSSVAGSGGCVWAQELDRQMLPQGGLIDDLQPGNLPAFRLVLRLDELELLNEEEVQQECKKRGLLWPMTQEKGELVGRLRREALLSELLWEELLFECTSCGVPLDSGPYFWGLSWFSDEQEKELREWLVRWCLWCESTHIWKDNGLPLLHPNEAVPLLEWHVEKENMSDGELEDLYLRSGLPDDVDLKRHDMLERLRQLRVWWALPIDELMRTVLDWGVPADTVGSKIVSNKRQLVVWLQRHLIDHIHLEKGIPVKDLTRQAAKELNDYFCKLGRMGQEELVEEHSCELHPPVLCLPPQELVERLTKIRKWSLVRKQALLDECRTLGLSDFVGRRSADEALDVLKWHECRRDFQQMGIPADRIPSFDNCEQLVELWQDIGAFAESQLKEEVSKLNLAFTGSSRVQRELLKEKAFLEKVRLVDLQTHCREIKGRNPTLRVNTIARKGEQPLLVKHLIQALWLQNRFESDVPSGRPTKLELLSFLARFQKRPLFKEDFSEAMCTWSWWDLRLFLQSHGLIDPALVATRRRKPAYGRVSVVVLTFEERQDFHLQVWQNFVAQTREEKELVVVETWINRPSPFFAGLNDERLVYVPLRVETEGEYLSLGTKHNWGTQLASGTYITNFADDDFYAPRYLDTMVQAMGRQGAITLRSWYTLEAKRGKFGYADPHCRQEDQDKILYGYGFSFVYERELARRVAYPDELVSTEFEHEEPGFFERIRESHILGSQGVALYVDNFGICLHCIHSANAENCDADEEVSPNEARMLEVRDLPSFESNLERLLRGPLGINSSIPHRPRVRWQKLMVKGFAQGSQRRWHIVVPAGSVVWDVKMQLKVMHGDIEGWESARLSTRPEKPQLLMEDGEGVPLRLDVLHVNFRCFKRAKQ